MQDCIFFSYILSYDTPTIDSGVWGTTDIYFIYLFFCKWKIKDWRSRNSERLYLWTLEELQDVGVFEQRRVFDGPHQIPATHISISSLTDALTEPLTFTSLNGLIKRAQKCQRLLNCNFYSIHQFVQNQECLGVKNGRTAANLLSSTIIIYLILVAQPFSHKRPEHEWSFTAQEEASAESAEIHTLLELNDCNLWIHEGRHWTWCYFNI